jgi:hypothetical protein
MPAIDSFRRAQFGRRWNTNSDLNFSVVTRRKKKKQRRRGASTQRRAVQHSTGGAVAFDIAAGNGVIEGDLLPAEFVSDGL